MRSLYSTRFQTEYDPSIRQFKKDVVARMRKAREDGVSASKMADAAGDIVSIGVVYDLLNAEMFGKEVWSAMDEGLKKLGY